MSVNFNVNQTKNSWAGVDVQNVNKITEQILNRAQQKTVDLTKVDLTKFNRASQGIDLYNKNVSLETQRYIAMQNAGMIGKTNNTIAQLNAQAAITLYGANEAEKVQGKITVGETQKDAKKDIDVFPVYKASEVFSSSNLGKDKRGSSSLFYERSSFENEDNTENVNIQI